MFFLSPGRSKPINYKTISLLYLPDWELTERGLSVDFLKSSSSCFNIQYKRPLRGLTNIFYSEIHEVDLWQVWSIG